MNSSQFMDKQILGLSAASLTQSGGGVGGGSEFVDLLNPQEDRVINGGSGEIKREEILPSYDFQPIRAIGSSSSPTTGGLDGLPSSSWVSVDSKLAYSNLKNASILEPHELTRISHKKEKTSYDAATVSEVDHTVKKHVDNLLHALEGVSSGLSQLESRTHRIESSVYELKVEIGNYHGSTDGKLRQFENILREVQTGVQALRDNQEIMVTQLHLAKLQSSTGELHLPEKSNTSQPESQQQQISPAQQHVQQPYHPPVTPPQSSMLLAVPPPTAPLPPAPPQNLPQFPAQPQPQIPSIPSLTRETYYQSAGQPTEAAHQNYQVPVQQPQKPPPPPLQHYQSAPQLPQYSQPTQSQQPVNPSQQLQLPIPQNPEESAPYGSPPPTYPPSIHQPAFPRTVSGPPQQFFGPPSSMYEPTGKPSSGQPPFSSGYGPKMGPSFTDPYQYSGSPSWHGSSAMKQSPPFNSSVPPTGGSSNYPQLPTAQVLPQAVPGGSSSGSSSGTRVPIDDIVEKVETMGFSRDQVRATVRKLTENGQSVDLNVVLDKLMNDREIQPQKGWFGR